MVTMRVQNRKGSIFVGVASLVYLAGCVSQPRTTAQITPSSPVSKKTACIEGRVTNSAGKPFSGVRVTTVPKTSTVHSGEAGLFQICFISKAVDSAQGKRFQRLPLPEGAYQVLFQKDGFKAKPIRIAYTKKRSTYLQIRVQEKEIVLLEPSGTDKDTPTDDSPRDGVRGPPPVGEP